MDFQPRQYKYKTELRWTSAFKGELSSEGKPNIDVALPKELGGHEGIWSPDDLFVASVEACAMLTFFWLLKDMEVDVQSYESRAEGVSQIASDGIFRFTRVVLRPTIIISKDKDLQKVEEAVKKLDNWCCISNSIKAEVVIEPEISVKKES